MQNVTSPRQNIHSLINSIRSIAQDVSREVGSNPQDPSFSIQPIQSQPNSSNMQSSIVQSHQKPVLTNSQTLSSNTNSNIPKQSGDMGTLLQGIQKAHAKVDEVIRSVPREVHDQVLSGQVRSLTNVPGVSSFQNLQNVPSSLQDISSSYRLTPVPSSSQPAYLQQNNPFAKNNAAGEIPITTTSTPYLVPPAANYGPRKSENVPGQPINVYQPTNYNLYQSVSLNEIPNQPEATEENRPKSLLYASNYFKSASKQDLQHQTPLQEKYKQFFPRQYPPTSSQQKVQANSMTQSQLDQSENIRKSQAVQKQEVHQTHPVEKILEKLRSQEERHKRQRFEEDAYVYTDADTYAENQTFSQAGYGKAESVRRASKRRESRDSRKHLELQEDTGSLILPNNISEQSVGVNSRQDIERRIEQIGKESRKPAPKKVIPSLGGGQLVIEKKESYDLERNTQVFGKEEKSSGGNMLRLGSRKRTDSSARDRNPEEFMVKRISSGHRRQRETDDEGFDFEGEDGDYEQYYYGEEPKRWRQPGQEEQDFQEGYQRSGKGNRSRSRIQNGDMVWSSQKKSKKMLKNIKF